jgi:hypothetical protein
MRVTFETVHRHDPSPTLKGYDEPGLAPVSTATATATATAWI